MHAPVGAVEFRDKTQQLEAAAQYKGVEQAHLHVGVGIEGQQLSIQSSCAQIVEQQPHLHAAVGRHQ